MRAGQPRCCPAFLLPPRYDQIVRRVATLTTLIAMFCAAQSSGRATGKIRHVARPECAPGAICFSGEVNEGQEFRRQINEDLDFVLRPGWEIAIVTRRPHGECQELASIVNYPLMGH